MIPVRRPVVRETSEVEYRTRRPLVIRLEPGGRLVRIKIKGHRMWYTVTIKQIYEAGAANKARDDRAERLRLREERRKARHKR